MFFMLLTASLISSLLPLSGATEGGLRLELASVVFRHGDRSPLYTFPNDTYKEFDWPQGYGQLSRVGMQQQFHLGELLKARYIVDDGCNGLVCSNYTQVQVRVRSTDIDRTLMSAEAQLSALFPPGPTQNFSSSLLWQPIPVHTLPADEDELLILSSFMCPAYAALMEKDKDLPEYKEMEAKYKDFLEDIGQKSGVNDLSLANVNRLTDTILIESVSDGYEPPDWVNDSVLDTMCFISDFIMLLKYNTKKKNRLSADAIPASTTAKRVAKDGDEVLAHCEKHSNDPVELAGMWLEKILLDMRNKSNPNGDKSVEDMKLFLYSAHDSTVAAMTSALQVYNNKQPGYASAFAVELYSNTSNNFFVKMFRRDGPDSETFDLLNVTYCKDSNLCTLKEFESFVMPLIPDDLAMECGNKPTTRPPNVMKQQSLEVIVIILGCILSLAVIIVMILAVILVTSYLKKWNRA